MEAVQIKCPNCGAFLDGGGDAETVTCSYCGTSSRVQRRSRVFQIPMRPPPVRPGGPELVARQVGSRVGVIVSVVIGLAILGGVAVAVLAVARVGGRVGFGGSGMSWNGIGPAIAADVDGDGTDDIVGLVRYVNDGDSMYLAAFSGKDAAKLWQGERLGSYSDVYQGRVALAGTTLLWADPRANLHAFELRTGAARWTKSAGDKIEVMCAGGDAGAIRVLTVDERWTIVELADGAMKPGEAAAGDRRADRRQCAALPGDERETSAGVRTSDDFDDRRDVDGMDVGTVLIPVDGPRVALGTRKKGSRIPMVALLDGAGGARWMTEVPSTDPLSAKLSGPELGAMGDREVVVAWEHQDGPPSLSSFELATGHRLWETRLQQGTTIVLSGLTISRTAVMVSTWGALQVFDRASGRPLFLIGRL